MKTITIDCQYYLRRRTTVFFRTKDGRKIRFDLTDPHVRSEALRELKYKNWYSMVLTINK